MFPCRTVVAALPPLPMSFPRAPPSLLDEGNKSPTIRAVPRIAILDPERREKRCAITDVGGKLTAQTKGRHGIGDMGFTGYACVEFWRSISVLGLCQAYDDSRVLRKLS